MKTMPIGQLDPDVAARAAARITAKSTPGPNGCILWTGTISRDGYGKIKVTVNGRLRQTGTHRAAWLAMVGPIPIPLVVDHLCRVRSCVNTAHMELVTNRMNTIRGEVSRDGLRAPCGPNGGAGAHFRERTECGNGHPYTPENTRIRVSNGYASRVCIACERERYRAWRRRNPGREQRVSG